MPRKTKQPPHIPYVFKNNCATKRRFGAKHLADAAKEHQQTVQPHLELSVYRCDTCGGWHLTRQQKSGQ